jgi:hypothetical protein
MPRAKASATTVAFTEQQWECLELLPEYTIAIDPGETVGFCATFGGETTHEEAYLGHHYGVGSLPMWDLLDYLGPFLRSEGIKQVVLEEYRVYPNQAMMHSGKTIPTAECIGAIKMLARQQQVPVLEQQAAIKKPIAGLLKGRGFKSLGSNQHEKDAECHMWYYALKDKLL